MTRLFAEVPKAVEETARFLDGLAFSLDELAHDYPEELCEGYATAQAALEAFADSGARARRLGRPASVTQSRTGVKKKAISSTEPSRYQR